MGGNTLQNIGHELNNPPRLTGEGVTDLGNMILGKKKKSSNVEQPLEDIAQSLYGQSQPLRDFWSGILQNANAGTLDPMASPTFTPTFNAAKTGIERAYGQGKENLLSMLPSGGRLDKGLTELELGRAKDLGTAPAQISDKILNDLLSKSFSSAWGQPLQSSLGAFNTVLGAQATREAAQAQAKGAKGQGIGQMIGTAGSMAMLA